MNGLKLLKKEDGAVLPIVALLLAFVIIGFTALVVDAGMLYAERRSLVTAADAAALGGAMILEDALAKPFVEPTQLEAEAIKVATDLAVANGVKNRADVLVDVIWKNETSNLYNRDYITVTVINNYGMMFARIFGQDSSDVAAKASATWGYITKVRGGDILPIFTKAGDYQTATSTYLHAGKFVDTDGSIVNGNWGLIDIYGNTAAISDAFEGEYIDLRMELNTVINNQTGMNAGNIANPIEERMKAANKLEKKEDRISYMCGLVPVIKWEGITKQGSSLSLPIEFFAVFEIQDVIIHGAKNDKKTSKGSTFALYDTDNYKSDGIAKEYDDEDADNLEKATIVGRFTGTKVQLEEIVQPNDQDPLPDPNAISPTYSRLIE